MACPSPYNSASCSCQSNVCQLIGTTWECDLRRCGETQGAQGTVVYGYSGTYDYSAWGVTASGNDFCCEITDTSITTIVLLGGAYDDTLDFQYSSTYDLDTHTAASAVQGRVSGNEGDDEVHGSTVASADYSELLAGNGGLDTVYGHEGDDEITGGDHVDYLDGGPGADYAYGDSGADTILGGTGDDHLYGGSGDDGISGGAGEDVLYGDENDDDLCGDNHTTSDYLNGGIGADELWGDTSGDSKNCGGHPGDISDSAGTNTGCTTSLSARPALCP